MHRHAALLIGEVVAVVCLRFVPEDATNPSLQIQLPDGLIQGRLRHAVDTGTPYYSYEGIPYAEPPVGELRFEPPQPPHKWDGVLDANGDVPVCFQIPPKGNEDEDCLYVNVYVPKQSSPASDPKAVMLWIYGGGFMLGAADTNIYGPDYLLEQDVIIVQFNYRLNVFGGFLSTGDMASPGNYGLKDQHAALNWTHSNIARFGGDPARITVFGESAGAVSVSYLLFSPKSEGLFQGAISQSGTTICPWALQTHPLAVARVIAASAGVHFANTASIIQHLKRMNATELRNAAINALFAESFKKEQGLTFAPVLEPDHDQAVITRSTLEMLRNGRFIKVPYMVGFNSQESGMAQKAVEIVRPLLGVLPNDILIPPSLNNWDSRIGAEIKKHYFKNGKARIEQYMELFSDTGFNRPIVETARYHSKHAPTYMYRFAYEGSFLPKKGLLPTQDHDTKGVSHAEELWYLFYRQDLPKANSTDKLVREKMAQLWSNFAKSGNPTPDGDLLLNVTWPRFEKDDYPYLNIDIDLSVEFNFKEKTMEFWRQLFAKYGRPPFNTY